jgi:type II secretory pathway pseudopilin PulG
MRQRNEAGETLVEIVLTIVIIGLAVTALLAGLSTAASASKAQRDLVTVDTVMRSYAEATKEAVRSCTNGGTYTVVYTAPPGYAVSGAGTTCPSTSAAQTRTLQVSGPNGTPTKTMTIMVRTP